MGVDGELPGIQLQVLGDDVGLRGAAPGKDPSSASIRRMPVLWRVAKDVDVLNWFETLRAQYIR
jgi:hypothetical protein